MHAVAPDFQERVNSLVAHFYDPSVPKPEFTDAEKQVVQALMARAVLLDADLKAAIDRHNARHASLQTVETAAHQHTCTDKKCPQYVKPKSFWDNAGQVVSTIGKAIPVVFLVRAIVKI